MPFKLSLLLLLVSLGPVSTAPAEAAITKTADSVVDSKALLCEANVRLIWANVSFGSTVVRVLGFDQSFRGL